MALLSALAATGGLSETAAGQAKESFDYLFVIDTSGSMVGKPQGSGNAVIFPQVKEAICSFIDSIDPGATLVFMPFHRDVQSRHEVALADDNRSETCVYVQKLEATGQVTWIYYSLRTALKRAEELRAGTTGPRIQTILLYTDGKDTGPNDLTLDGILKHFKLQRAENEHLYLKYVTLGVELTPQEETKLKATPGVTVEENPKGEVQPIGIVEVRPARLSFGSVAQEAERTAEIALNAPDALKGRTFGIVAKCPGAEKLGGIIEIAPETSTLGEPFAPVKLRVHNVDSLRRAEPQEFECTLRLKSDAQVMFVPAEITATFDTFPPMIARVLPDTGTMLKKDLGVLTPDSENRLVARAKFRLSFNDAARQRGMALRARVEESKGNPESLPAGWGRLSRGKEKPASEINLTSESAGFELVLDLAAEGVKPGQYHGQIVLECDEGVLEGSGLASADGASATAKAIPFSFGVPAPPRPPTPLWVWVLVGVVGVALLSLVGFSARTATFPEGACLEAGGDSEKLEGRFGKPSLTVGGARSDVNLSTLAPKPVLMVSPGKGHALVCRPVTGVLVQTSGGDTLTPAGTMLEPGDELQVDDPPIRLQYVKY